MLDADNADIQSTTLYGKVALAVLLLVLAYVSVLMEPDEFKASLNDEIHQIDQTLGEDSAVLIIDRAKVWYRFTFVDSGIAGLLNTMSMDTGYKGDSSWRTPMARIGENLKMLWYQACMRASVTWFWLFLIAPMFIASVADGYYQRKIKQHEFTISSTGFFRLSYWFVIVGIIGIKLYFIIPSAGLMNPLFPLIVGVIMAVLARNIISNASKIM